MKTDFRNWGKQINLPEKLAVSAFMSYSALILMPGLLWRIPNKWYFPILLVMISILAMLFDKDMPKQAFIHAMIRYACAGIIALFYGWINRGPTFDWMFYLSKGLLAWYPVVFVCYLIKKRNNSTKMVIKYGLFFFIAFTCITTLISIRQFPYASRWLSSGQFDSTSAVRLSLSRLNLGSYSFVYMLVLLTPVLLGMINLSSNRRAKLMYSGLSLLLGATILLTQFLIAIYMVILCLGVILIARLLKYAFTRRNKQLSLFARMLCAVPVVLTLFMFMFKPLNAGLDTVFTSLDLGSLSERIESLSALDKPEERLDSLGTSVGNAEDYSSEILDQDSLLQNSSDPLGNRLLVYLRPLKTVSNNWLTGNLLSQNVITSQHSDIIDAVTGGGILGGVFIICLYFVMLYGLYEGKLNHKLDPYAKLSFFMCVGLATINSIYYSREIFLVCIVMPVVGDAMFVDESLSNEKNINAGNLDVL